MLGSWVGGKGEACQHVIHCPAASQSVLLFQRILN